MAKEVELSAKGKRKLRRKAENEFYAKDARFWHNPKSADRMGYDRPVNTQATRDLSNKVPKKKR
jgi:hypothetical protein